MKKLINRNEFYLFIILLATSLVIGGINKTFFSAGSLTDISRALTVYGIFAIGAMVVIISGGIDISFPAIATLSAYVALKAFPAGENEGTLLLFVALACFIGIVLGLINGIFISLLEFPSLIVTLATSSTYYGFLYTVLESRRITSVPLYITELSRSSLFTITGAAGETYILPKYFLFFVAALILVTILLKHTIIGRGIFAIGGNKSAAIRIGFRVKAIQMFVYGLAGFLAALAGVVYTVVTRQGDPAALIGTELTIITIVVLGGVNINGGIGTPFGLLLGLIFVTIINNSLILVGLPSQWHTLILGLALYSMAAVTAYKTKTVENQVNELELEDV